ncbi:hypothetical protein RPMD05_59 [Rhodobacteraceae phage LS06-2018-MD05]|nr:hypothetical protein RPMD05_59 [Rhodobacteraceae phage LS06-2018-MD05]
MSKNILNKYISLLEGFTCTRFSTRSYFLSNFHNAYFLRRIGIFYYNTT